MPSPRTALYALVRIVRIGRYIIAHTGVIIKLCVFIYVVTQPELKNGLANDLTQHYSSASRAQYCRAPPVANRNSRGRAADNMEERPCPFLGLKRVDGLERIAVGVSRQRDRAIS